MHEFADGRADRHGRDPEGVPRQWETHLIAAGANTDDVAAIAGHSINVQAEHYRQALNRSSDFIKAAIG